MKDCVFCKIINNELPSYKLCENKHAIAILDVSPISDGHTLIISKKHYQNFSSCPDEVLSSMSLLSKQVANKLFNSSLKPWGMNYLSNENAIAGQVINHFHIHVIPKYSKNEGFVNNKGLIRVDDVKSTYEKLKRFFNLL